MLYFWIVIIIILTIIEAASVSLTTIWFVASALIALVVSFFTDNLFIQFGIFTIGGVVLLILTRPLLKKYIDVNKEKTNLDRVVGMKGVVTEKIENLGVGEVKVDGKKWSAIADTELEEKTVVRIKDIKGVKLIVERWED
jgi:membrane protein implicated in regulation of membrane protease activity